VIQSMMADICSSCDRSEEKMTYDSEEGNWWFSYGGQIRVMLNWKSWKRISMWNRRWTWF